MTFLRILSEGTNKIKHHPPPPKNNPAELLVICYEMKKSQYLSIILLYEKGIVLYFKFKNIIFDLQF